MAFNLMELRRGGENQNPVNKPGNGDPQFTPMRVNRRYHNEQTQQTVYDPPKPGDYVSRLGTHEVATTIAIDPWLAVARWPNLPTINPARKPKPGMPTGRWRSDPGRKNIARRGDQTYGSLSQLYPHIDTAVN